MDRLTMLRALCSMLVPGPDGNGRWSGPFRAGGPAGAAIPPPGGDGSDPGDGSAGVEPADEVKIPESEHKAALKRQESAQAAAFVKLRKENTGLQERLAALESAAAEKATAGKTSEQQTQERIDRLEREAAKRVEEAKSEASRERQLRHDALVGHAIQAEINKRGWKEPELIEAYLRRSLAVTEDGQVVRMDGELATDLGRVFDEFGKAHPGVIPGATAGSGSRPGTPARPGKKLPGELTGGDLERAADEELRNMRRGDRPL